MHILASLKKKTKKKTTNPIVYVTAWEIHDLHLAKSSRLYVFFRG